MSTIEEQEMVERGADSHGTSGFSKTLVKAPIEPWYENAVVDLAGDALIGDWEANGYLDSELIFPIDVVNNWRSAHTYPLNTFQMTLRNRARRIDNDVVVAQRIKRLSSIRDKLQRYPWLKLSTMQDIAGVRAIVPSVSQVYEIAKGYHAGYSEHRLDDRNDYISNPKRDGYRSYHLIFRYTNMKHHAYVD